MAQRRRIVVRRKKAPTKFLKKVGKWFKKQGKKLKQGVGKMKLLWRAKVSKKPIRRKDLERAGMMTPELKAQYDMIDQMKAAEKAAGSGGAAGGGFQSHADVAAASGGGAKAGGRSGGGVRKPKLMPNMSGGSISARWKARNANRKAKMKNMFAANNSSPATKRHINIKLNSVGQNAATADKNSKNHYQNNFKKATRPRVLKDKNTKYKY